MLWTRYWVTDAVGLHELLMLCELAKSLPQLSVYTGYSMGAQYIPLNMSQQFALDALDMVEYTTGLCATLTSLSIYTYFTHTVHPFLTPLSCSILLHCLLFTHAHTLPVFTHSNTLTHTPHCLSHSLSDSLPPTF